MGNHHLLPCCAACYDGYDGCCLPVQLNSHHRQHRDPDTIQSWSWDDGWNQRPQTHRNMYEDDDSYIENYRYNFQVDKSPGTNPSHGRQSSGNLNLSSVSVSSSQESEAEGVLFVG